MIKAVIFDVGGVLLQEVASKIYKALTKNVGRNLQETRTIGRKLVHKFEVGSISEDKFWKDLAEKLGSNKNYVKKIWLGTFKKNLCVRKSVIKLAADLKRHGYKVAILSNAIKLHYDHIHRKNVYQLFSPVVLSFEVGMKKPRKNIYRLVAKKMRLKPEECIFIDDKEKNVKAAEEVGMHGIVFKNVAQLKDDLKKVL